jgi:WD40 repeat protein/serine/threonine protein kinase/two-component SAPR family response regulator
MGQLYLSLFGQFQAILNGKPITAFRTQKVQALLIYLVAESKSAHRRERLMELLWPGMPESSARSNLRQILFHLRRTLSNSGDHGVKVPFLIVDRHTLRLNPDADITVDTAHFDAKLRLVQAHDHVELLACRTCEQAFHAATSLFQGDFLADFYLDDSNEFEEWAEIVRQQYRHKMLDTLETLTTIALRRSAFAEARNFAEQQIEIDNLHESAYRQLMETLARSGQRAAALSHYESYKRLLMKELRMAPSTQTTALYETIHTSDLHFEMPIVHGARGYELKEEIGEGDFGIVYRAVQSTIGRDVVIKIIHHHFANNPDLIRRFESKAQTIAKLEHPHIVPLYDYWRDPYGAYLVMRYMRGGNLLSSSLEQGPYELEQVLKMLEQVADALSAAHRRGIVHGNIKPANILMDVSGNSYISDFSILSKSIDETHKTNYARFVDSFDYTPPELILNEPVGPTSDIYSLGILLYEVLTGHKPFAVTKPAQKIQKHLHEPVPLIHKQHTPLSPKIDSVIQRATAKQPANRYSDVLDLAEGFRKALHGQEQTHIYAVARSLKISNPYKGLRPFQEADAPDFFGRHALIQHLLSRLDGNPFLAIVGPSGSGKSSIVKAGLIPALRAGALSGSEKWFLSEMIPGHYPLEELEKALWAVAVDPPPSLVEPMSGDNHGLLHTLHRILPGKEKPTLLLVIDQFEELFTMVKDQQSRDHFIESILTALAEPNSPLRVIITLRADLFDRPLQQQVFGRWLKENTEVILPLSPEELTEAIIQPARQVGVALEEGLVATIVSDVQDEPGALPLLQYALTELFDRRQDSYMTLTAYNEIGGVSGALARRAEDLFARLDVDDQDTARQVFLRLVSLGEGGVDTRRRVPRSELVQVAPPETGSKTSNTAPNHSKIEHLLDLFGRYRLLTFDHDPLTRGPTVEVAHEALLLKWERLRNWLETYRDDIRRQRLLTNATAEWMISGKDDGYLFHGARLRELEGWFADSNLILTKQEQAFIEASLSARQARKVAVAVQQAREDALEARSRNSQRYLIVVLSMSTVIATILLLFAVSFSRQAQQEARLARSRELAAAAVSNLVIDPELSVLLALEGLNTAYTVEAENALHRSIPQIHLLQTLTGHNQSVETLAISPDGARFASVSADGLVIVWEATTGKELLRFSAGRQIIFGMVFSPDGKQLITASEDQSARIWNITTGEQIFQIGHGAPLSDVAISPDGLRLITAGSDAATRIWDAKNGRQILALRGHAISERLGSLHPGGVVSVAFTPDGHRIVTGGADGTVRLWDAGDGQILHVLSEHTNEVFIDLSGDGNRLLTAGFDGLVKIWDISLMKDPPEQLLAINNEQPARDAAFSPDGRLVAVAGQDSTVKVWNGTSGQSLMTLVGHTGLVDDLSFTPDGRKLVTASEDKTLKVWELDPGREWLTIIEGYPIDVAYSRDGRQLATSHPDGTLTIRESTSGQVLRTLPGHPEFEFGAIYLAYSPDGNVLASASWDRTVKLWDVTNGQEILTLAGHTNYVWQADFSPDGALLATASQDGSARVWDTATGRELFTLSDDQREVVGVAFNPDGNRIATVGCLDNSVRIWDSKSGQQLMRMDADNCFWGVDFSPDGMQLAAGLTDGSVIIWDVTGDNAQIITILTGHTALTPRLAFSPDGEKLATASFDGTAKVWKLPAGQEWLTFSTTDWVTNVAFHPNGSKLATAGRDGHVRVWILNLEELVALARSRLTRDLTQEECQKFLHANTCPGTASEK